MPSNKSVEYSRNKGSMSSKLIVVHRKEYRYYAVQTNRNELVYREGNRDYAVQINR